MDKHTVEKWGNLIQKTVFSQHYVGCEVEGNLQVAVSFAQILKKDVYLFGTQSNMDCFIKFFQFEGLHLRAIIDRKGENLGGVLLGVPMISLANVSDIISEPENAVIFSFSELEGDERKNFEDIVKEQIGIRHIYYVNGIERRMITTNSVEACDKNRIIYYRDRIEDIIKLLPYYADEESFQVMNEYIRTYSERDVYRDREIETKYKYFFDKNKTDIYTHLDDEVWLNFGASTGDTVFTFFRNGLKARAIYAVEADQGNYEQLTENIKLLPDEMQKCVIAKNIFVDEKTNIDELLNNETVTLINADIEGYELSMLKLLREKIRREHPVLAICLYHKKEDLIDIPGYIKELYDGYRFVLRKYLFCWGNADRNEELVLYAIPENRMIH